MDIPGFSLVTGAYFHTNLADEISTKVNLLPVGLDRSVARSCFFLEKGMADGSLGKEIRLKSISDGVVFCYPIIPKGPHFRVPQNHHRMSRFTTHHAKKQNTGCGVKENDR